VVVSYDPTIYQGAAAHYGRGRLARELEAIATGTAATVITLEPVEGLCLSASEFRAFLQEHPRVAMLLLQGVTRRLIDSDRKRVEFGAYDSVGRVARRLVELVDRYGEPVEGGMRITLPISQDELAGWVGISRKAASNALQVLRQRGWIQTGARRSSSPTPTRCAHEPPDPRPSTLTGIEEVSQLPQQHGHNGAGRRYAAGPAPAS
jgi:CRP/FNR family cyclic AMP-dependent transcriptional regulator